jgi:hypothetical protein
VQPPDPLVPHLNLLLPLEVPHRLGVLLLLLLLIFLLLLLQVLPYYLVNLRSVCLSALLRFQVVLNVEGLI